MKMIIVFIALVLTGAAALADNSLLPYLPDMRNTTCNRVDRQYYSTVFDTVTHVPERVVYRMAAHQLSVVNRDGMSFKPDPLAHGSVAASNYAKSGYDLGHLCPAEDMSFDAETMRETFYTSNVAPQAPGFNRGIWKALEARVRKLSETGHELIIITGPIYLPMVTPTIGRDKVAVPAGFYKIIIDKTAKTTTAYLFPNADQNQNPLDSFIVPAAPAVQP